MHRTWLLLIAIMLGMWLVGRACTGGSQTPTALCRPQLEAQCRFHAACDGQWPFTSVMLIGRAFNAGLDVRDPDTCIEQGLQLCAFFGDSVERMVDQDLATWSAEDAEACNEAYADALDSCDLEAIQDARQADGHACASVMIRR